MKHYMSERRSVGFTLVELMVVISIIGILSAIVYASLGESRKIARDSIRQTDLKNLQVAIELYKAQNGRYPLAGCSAAGWSGPGATTYTSCDIYIDALMPDYIATLPTDPKDESGDRGYLYRTNAAGTDYKVLINSTVESKVIKSYTDDFARCPQSYGSSYCGAAGPSPTTYAVYKGSTGMTW